MVYVRIVTGVIAAPEGFHRGADLSFAAPSLRRDVERYFLWSCGAPLGLGSRHAKDCSPDGELL